MKLNINFMIKDGKKIISRDTRGYKVLLNKVQREFDKVNKHFKTVNLTIIIQNSEAAAINHSGNGWKQLGVYNSESIEIVMYRKNCEDHKKFLAWLAHELGHCYHHHCKFMEWCRDGQFARERFADKFAKKMTKIEIKSVSGLQRSIAAKRRVK